MRLYYEASEIPVEPLGLTEFIRIDITDMDDTEKSVVLTAIKDVMKGVNCKFTEHTCLHDEGGSCTMVEI